MSDEQLPALTPAVLNRAKEGLAAAQNSAVRGSIQAALTELEQIVAGKPESRFSGKFRRWVLRRVIHFLFRVRVDFSEKIPDFPALIAANHLNHIDPFLLLAEASDFPYYYILGDSRTLYNKWWKRQILGQSGGVIPIERRWREELAVIAAAREGDGQLQELAAAIERYVLEASNIKVLRQLSRIIQAIFARGDGILLFPEGRLGQGEGRLQLPFKRGTALYALQAGVPIVPVALVGTQHLYWRKELRIRWGNPLFFGQVKRPSREEIEAVLVALEQALSQLLLTDYQEPKEVKLFANFLNHMFE
jgi:1-acyl-sn-glycerol-3-phosphate acyltransferase